MMGNNDLAGLKEITLPEPMAYTPQTLFWYMLFGILFLILVWLVARWVDKRRQNRYRKLALERLRDIHADWRESGEIEALREIPELVKWTALQGFSRPEVAGLSGVEWLAFLDRTRRGKKFSRGPGRILPRLAYDCDDGVKGISPREIKKMTALVRRWIRGHRV